MGNKKPEVHCTTGQKEQLGGKTLLLDNPVDDFFRQRVVAW